MRSEHEELINVELFTSQLTRELDHAIKEVFDRNEGNFHLVDAGPKLFWATMTSTLMKHAANCMAHEAVRFDVPDDYFSRQREKILFDANSFYVQIKKDVLSGRAVLWKL